MKRLQILNLLLFATTLSVAAQPPHYDFVDSTTIYIGDNKLVRVKDSCFLVNSSSNATMLLADLPNQPQKSLYPAIIAANSKYGYLKANGKVAIEGRWDYASPFAEGLARVVCGEGLTLAAISVPSAGKTGYIDTLGRYIIEMDYSFIDHFSPKCHVARFTRGAYLCNNPMGCENPYKGSKWGLIDKTGKIVVLDDRYDFIDRGVFDQKSGKVVFGVICGDKIGIIDASGATIFPLTKFDSLGHMWDTYDESIL